MLKTLFKKIEMMLQDFFHIDIAYYKKNGFFQIVGYSVEVVKGVVLSILLARILSPVVYGKYKYILSFLPIFSYLALSAAADGVIQGVAKKFEATYFFLLKKTFYWALLNIPAAIALALFSYFRNQKDIALIFVCLIPIMPFYSTVGLYSAYWIGKRNFRKNATIVGVNAIVVLVVVASLVVLRVSLLWQVVGFVVITTLIKLFFEIEALMASDKNSGVDSAAVSYSNKMSILGVIMVIRSNIDKILLANFVGFSDLALYSVATVIPDQIKSIFSVILQPAIPRFVAYDSREIFRMIDKKIFHIILFAGVFFGGILIAIPYVIPLVFGAQYRLAVVLSMLCVGSSFLPSIVQPYMIAMNAKTQAKKLYIINVSFSVIELALLVICIPLWGMYGAIFAKTISRVYISGAAVYFSRQK